MSNNTIAIASESLIARIHPEFGGSIVSLRDADPGHSFNWLRETPGAALNAHNPLELACFPLVPYSNLIRDGRIALPDGESIQLPLHIKGFPHTSHGDGWLKPWDIDAVHPSALSISYSHSESGHPYVYTARQCFSVENRRLKITMSVVNESDTSLPFGLGLHPYFPFASDAVLTTDFEELWEVDKDFLPTQRTAISERWCFSSGRRLQGSDLNHAFGGWSGNARITWPTHEKTLTISASPELSHVVLYVPRGEDYFCVEPVSHAVDAFNLAAKGERNVGYRVLAPGQHLSSTVQLITMSHGDR